MGALAHITFVLIHSTGRQTDSEQESRNHAIHGLYLYKKRREQLVSFRIQGDTTKEWQSDLVQFFRRRPRTDSTTHILLFLEMWNEKLGGGLLKIICRSNIYS